MKDLELAKIICKAFYSLPREDYDKFLRDIFGVGFNALKEGVGPLCRGCEGKALGTQQSTTKHL
jgi:hypothetical protein